MVNTPVRPRITMHRHARLSVWLTAAAAVMFMSIYLPLASTFVQALSPAPTAVAAAPSIQKRQVATQKATASPAATAVAAAPVTTPAVATTPYPNCTVLYFGMPSQLNLDSAAAGLTVRADAPTTYQIYGNIASELRSQIQQCAPGAHDSSSAEFTAQTSYNLAWQYDTLTNGDGNCNIGNVKVGVHTAMALPLWQPNGNASTGLSDRWQRFTTSLQTHEQGHATLDTAYAAQLVTNLNAIGSQSCTSIANAVANTVNSSVAALNAANDAYDASTNHGATQGAVLPSY